jgi:hypothetical protein
LCSCCKNQQPVAASIRCDGTPMHDEHRTDCPWCGALLLHGESLGGRIRCRSCGVATCDPWPSDAQLDIAYADSYRPESGRFSGLGDALLARTRGSLSTRIERIAPAGPVLDVGAGDGHLVRAIGRRGRVAVGLERPESGTSPKLDLRSLAEQGQETWASVIFWHSLEHIREPAQALADGTRLLAPRGVLVVSVPNSASLQAQLFGNRWLALDPPRHLVHLTHGILIDRIQELGLVVERVSHIRGGQVLFGWLHGLVGLLPGHPDLYDAIRRPEARSHPMSRATRALTILASVISLPPALLGAAMEIAFRRGGTVYVEARKPGT